MLPLRRLAPLSVLVTGLLGCGAASKDAATKVPSTGIAEPAPSSTEDQEAEGDSGLRPISEPVELRYPRSRTSWLGVELRAQEGAAAGVEITRVLSGSPAEKAELLPGDILLTLDQTAAQSPADVSAWVRAQPPATSFPLTVLRKGEPRLLRAVLEGMPEFEDRLRLSLVNRKAPEISGVATFQGEAASLRELRGQVVVLEFWASFCGVCRFLAPQLDQWHRTYQPQGASVVGITSDAPALGLEVAERTGMSYTLASDPENRVTNEYLASQIPTVVIIDRKGVVRDVMVGYSGKRLKETEALILELLRHSP